MSRMFLVGMPGVGKSYWAREVAAAYGRPLVDMDEYIEQRAGITIAQLFEQQGETAFRTLERNTLEQIIQNIPDSIVACGGGTPCYFDNMELMKKSGRVVYLRSTIPVLIDHLQHVAHKRPLLAGKPHLDSYLHDMLAKRSAFYEKAHHIVDIDTISVTTFAQILDHV